MVHIKEILEKKKVSKICMRQNKEQNENNGRKKLSLKKDTKSSHVLMNSLHPKTLPSK